MGLLLGTLGTLALNPPAQAAVTVQTTTVDLSGPQGGPFPPGNTTVQLVNDLPHSVLWRVRQSPNWAIFSSTVGTLPAGGTGSVQVSINHAVANLLPVGTYDALILYRTPPGQPLGVLADITLTVQSVGQATMSTASRTGGVAPLTVFFDAVGSGTGVVQPTGSTPDYASPHYRWGFADSSSGNWTISGKSKNVAYGYVAAHVFENPGTYRVTLDVTQPTGSVDSYYQDITVTNPDTVYAGQTYYVSAAGSDSNNGQSPTTSFRTVSRAMGTLFASNGPRSVLFRRGETFTATSTITTSNRTGPFTIGAYGSGAKPIISVTHSGNGVYLDPSVRDVRITDVDFRGINSGRGIELGRDSLVLRSTVRNFDTGLSGSSTNCINNTFADCTVLDQTYYGMYYAPQYDPNVINDPPIHLAILGTRFDNSVNSLLRTYVSRSVWQSNLFQRSQTSTTRLLGIQQPKKAEFVVISDNQFSSASNWVLEIGPENSQNGTGIPQIVENVLIEGNRFTAPAPGTADRFIMIWGKYVTVRNNVFDHTGANWGASIDITRRGIGPVPVGTRIDNNTVYRGTASAGPWYFVSANSQDLTLVRNNIVYGAVTTASVALGTVSQQANQTGNPLFEGAGSGNFALLPNSPAINVGAVLPVRIDFRGNPRPMQPGLLDVGAMERQ